MKPMESEKSPAEASAISQPAETIGTKPKNSANSSGSAGHQNFGLPYRQKSASSPHVLAPSTSASAPSNVSDDVAGGSAPKLPGSVASARTMVYPTHTRKIGATT